ncbi:MAG: DUF4157 domain-containing protein [Bacteroidetes bacterium]|nr:DUF4157 domain-containing protein [Bacteroidota bacterium]
MGNSGSSGVGGAGSGGLGGGPAGSGMGNSIRSIPVHRVSHRAVQTKLTVNQPGDPFEQEADSVADRVMRMPEPRVQRAGCTDCEEEKKAQATPQVMRMPEPRVQRAGCTDCAAREKDDEHRQTVQRKSNGVDGAAGTVAPPVVHQALNRPGQPLDRATRGFMEPRFGRDFGNVRVHSDGMAAGAARAIDAQAYTVGNHIVFGAGRYAPGTQGGRQLIAHELTHTIQQGGAPVAASQNTSGAGARSSEGPAVPAAPRVSRMSGERVARAGTTGDQPPQAAAQSVEVTVQGGSMTTKHVVTPGRKQTNNTAGGTSATIQEFNVDQFVVPGSKGPDAVQKYNAIANSGALTATLEVDGSKKTALWQKRASTDTLRDSWLRRAAWPSGREDELWNAAGGDATFPKIKGAACQMDHIVELQTGGGNDRENIQTLDAAQNSESGRAIRQELSGLGTQIVENGALVDGAASEIILRFNRVATQGAMETMPADCTSKPNPATCLSIDHCATAVGKRAAAAQPGTTTTQTASTPQKKTEPYSITVGGKSATLLVPEGFNKSKSSGPVPIHGSPENSDSAELISGFLLLELKREAGVDTIRAQIDPRGEKGGTRLPITIEDKRGSEVVFNVAGGTGLLSLKNKTAAIDFQYPYLSPGKIKKLQLTPDNHMEFDGVINSTVPLLGTFDVGYHSGKFAATKVLDKKSLKPNCNGMRITNANVALELGPEFKPSGIIAFEAGPIKHPIVSGSVEVTADAQGFLATGNVKATVPGMDAADGAVTYRPADGWSGSIALKTSQKFVRNMDARLQFDKEGVSITGGATIGLSEKQEITLKAEKEKGEKWVFKGSGIFDVPGGRVKPVEMNFAYDGTKVTGSGNAGFKLNSLSGEIQVFYNNGAVSGKGAIQINRKKTSGTINVNLGPGGKLTGKGNITYMIAPDVSESAGIEIDQNDQAKFTGALQFAKPIKLFGQTKGDQNILSAGMSFPIPGASIGTVGLEAEIGGSLNAGYYVGPGELRNVTATVLASNPLDENPNLDLTLSGQLYFSAGVSIGGKIYGGIKLDLLGVASASGGLEASATARLDASTANVVTTHYAKGRFELDANIDATLRLALDLALKAYVRAEAGIGPFKWETHKDWTLASFTYDSGKEMRIHNVKPIHFASDQPFKAPSLDDFQVDLPQIGAQDMLEKGFGGATAKETKS